MKARGVALCVLGLCLLAMPAIAAPLIVTSANPAWVQISGPNDPAYVLPATIPGCGQENEPVCEPTGIWYSNQTWAGFPSYVSMVEASGALSDILLFDSNGPNGAMRIMFFSDPDLPDPSTYAGYDHYSTVIESGSTTTYLVCCTSSPLYVKFGSDEEASYDPFGAGYDTSDGIQFLGATSVPEPASLTLVGLGLAAISRLRRRR